MALLISFHVHRMHASHLNFFLCNVLLLSLFPLNKKIVCARRRRRKKKNKKRIKMRISLAQHIHEGADSIDSVKRRVVANSTGTHLTNDWNLSEIRTARVKIQPGPLDFSQFWTMSSAKTDMVGNFILVDGELYVTACSLTGAGAAGAAEKYEVCAPSKSSPLTWDHFAAGVTAYFEAPAKSADTTKSHVEFGDKQEESFTIIVKTLTGKSITVEGVYPSLTVSELQKKLQDKEGFPISTNSVSFSLVAKWKRTVCWVFTV